MTFETVEKPEPSTPPENPPTPPTPPTTSTPPEDPPTEPEDPPKETVPKKDKDVIEEEVPLAAPPQTGDSRLTYVWILMAGAAALYLFFDESSKRRSES